MKGVYANAKSRRQICVENTECFTRSSATAEIARATGDETVIQGHLRSPVVVPIDAARIVSY